MHQHKSMHSTSDCNCTEKYCFHFEQKIVFLLLSRRAHQNVHHVHMAIRAMDDTAFAHYPIHHQRPTTIKYTHNVDQIPYVIHWQRATKQRPILYVCVHHRTMATESVPSVVFVQIRHSIRVVQILVKMVEHVLTMVHLAIIANVHQIRYCQYVHLLQIHAQQIHVETVVPV